MFYNSYGTMLCLVSMVGKCLSQAGEDVIKIDFNQQSTWSVFDIDIVQFEVSGTNSNSSLILFDSDIVPGQVCASNSHPETYSQVIQDAPQLIGVGYFFTLDFAESDAILERLGTESSLAFGLVDEEDECVEDVLALVIVSTFTPSPTSSPIEPIVTIIPWNMPDNLQRFSQEITLTEGEEITFDVLSEHNLIELQDEEHFASCNFTAARPEDFLVRNEATSMSVPFHEPGEVRYFSCNKSTGLPDEDVPGWTLSHCKARGQKMKVTVLPREDPVSVSWYVPVSAREREAFTEVEELNISQAIRFVLQQDELNIRQFMTKEAYDNCAFYAGQDGSDFLAGGNPSFEVRDTTESNSNVLYRDFMQGSSEEYNVLYFGSSTSTLENENCEFENACLCGLKKTFRVRIPNIDEDVNEDEEEMTLYYALLAGGVGGCLFFALAIIVFRRREEIILEAKIRQATIEFDKKSARSNDGYDLTSAGDSSFTVPRSIDLPDSGDYSSYAHPSSSRF